MSSLHYFLPGLVDFTESFGFFRQLFGNVTSDKNRLQINPHVLNQQPPLEDFIRVGQIVYPLLNLLPKRSVVPKNKRTCNFSLFLDGRRSRRRPNQPVRHERAQNHQTVLQLTDSFGRGVTSQQQFPSVVERHERQLVNAPLARHLT